MVLAGLFIVTCKTWEQNNAQPAKIRIVQEEPSDGSNLLTADERNIDFHSFNSLVYALAAWRCLQGSGRPASSLINGAQQVKEDKTWGFAGDSQEYWGEHVTWEY